PLNGIDIIAREQILKAIVEVAGEDKTLVISSHLVDELETIVDSVIFLKLGSLVLAGDAEEIRMERGKSIVELYKEVYA
ncbi:MAG: ABC transporter ATP-binding protein, partial [Lachnospiraceae bacterium]|nr:ABC transporter ATP-binding protein [Lachnospiraceae bacterium]